MRLYKLFFLSRLWDRSLVCSEKMSVVLSNQIPALNWIKVNSLMYFYTWERFLAEWTDRLKLPLIKRPIHWMHRIGWSGLRRFYLHSPPLSTKYSHPVCSWSLFLTNIPRSIVLSTNHRSITIYSTNKFSGVHLILVHFHNQLSTEHKLAACLQVL